MTKKIPAYEDLKEQSVEIRTLQSILTLLHWDQETYMPPGGIEPRSKQIALLSSLIHDKHTGKKYRAALEKLISINTGKVKIKGLSREKQVALREWHREFLRMDKLPTSFVREFAQTTSEAGPIWSTAKKQNNFKLFAPFLEKIIALNQKKAELFGFDDHPYDALLKSYEPCMTTKRVAAIFSNLKKELKALLKKISEAKQIDDRFLHRKVPDATQMGLARQFLAKLPMEPEYSRIDISNHPFSLALHPHDSRITTRILSENFISNILSTLHEMGHSLYEMGLSVEEFGTPLGEWVSLSVHESQSRWWETLIGRSYPFWKGFYPLVQEEIPYLKKYPLDRFYRGLNRVCPSFTRVEADEVTYCLHVILRFEIEQDLISGKLPVGDLPHAWNEKMEDSFGIVPPSDTMGCLQDIHWSLGDFGYFPTYALGNILAAHFFSAFVDDHPDWDAKVAAQEFSFIRKWLKEKVHKWGKTYNTEELAKKITGKPLSEKAYTSYLKEKYSDIYRL